VRQNRGGENKERLFGQKTVVKMKEQIMTEKDKATEATVRNIRLKTHKKNSPEEKIWILLYGL